MKYYRFTDATSGADVTVTTGEIGDAQLIPILAATGLNTASESIGLNAHSLRQVTVSQSYLPKLAIAAGCRLTVREDDSAPVELVADGAFAGGQAPAQDIVGGEANA